jgi:hypothetical protein
MVRSYASAGIALFEPDKLSDGRVLRRWRIQDKTNVAHS